MKKTLLLLFFIFTVTPVLSQNENENPNAQKTFKVKKLKPIKRNYKQNPQTDNFLLNTASSTSISSGSNEINETQGDLSVSLTGGATYSVPIKVPPGINGIEPEIALTYNSQGGNGLAGYGWNLSGLSVITRIPKTDYHDGEVGGVDLSQNDRFSFDGQRLVLKSGTYGAAGSVYETENYSNLKIEAFSSYNNGPGYFKVTYPDGAFAYYGQNYNSKTPMDYAITYWQNPQGVRISYEYNISYNTLSISKIKYGSRLTSTPINEIHFDYKTRQRKEQSYVGGSRFVRNTILSKIMVLGNGVGFRNYELSHLPNSLGYERISSIQEKSGNNLKSFDPITFNYQETLGGTAVAEANGNIGLSNVEQRNAIATSFDIGGEGVMDFSIHAKSISQRDKFWIYENVRDATGSYIYPYEVTVGTFQELFPVSSLSHNGKILPGQGLAVVQNTGSSNVDFRILNKAATGVHLQYEKTWAAPTYTNQYDCDRTALPKRVPLEYLTGDFNGDGLTDVIALTKSYTRTTCYETLPQPGDTPCELEPFEPVPLNATNSSEENIPAKENNNELSAQRLEPIDGGCCQCNTYSYNSSRAYFVNLKRDITTNFVNHAGYLSSTLSSSDELLTADINADGKTDILQVKNGIVYAYTLNDNNSLTLLFSYSSSYINNDYPILLGDYNGDGKTDFMYPTADNSTYFATFLSTGISFYRYNQTQPFTYKKTWYDGRDGTGTVYSYDLIPTDINGDGRTDMIDYRTTTYNYSNSGTQTIRTYDNSPSSSSYGNPKFSYKDTKSQSGFLKHYPIPIFLNSEQKNFNLEFCSVSDQSITAFEFQKDNREDMLLRSVGQNGVFNSIYYESLSIQSSNYYYGSIYSSTYNEIYPYVDIHYAPGFKLVRNLTRTGSGIATIKKDFLYHGAVSNVKGLGFSGFKGFAASNWYLDYNDRTFTVEKYDPHLRGLPTENYTAIGFPYFNSSPSSFITKTNNFYSTPQISANKVFKVFKTASVTENALNGSSENMSFTYDAFLNPKIIIANYSTGETERQEFYYSNSTGSNYYIGRLTKKAVISTINGNSFTNEESYTYNAEGLIAVKSLKGNGASTNSFNFSYDIYGNVISSTFNPVGETPLTTTYEYDQSGRFIEKKVNPEGLEKVFSYNLNNGFLNSQTDPFGFQTTYTPDEWFRVTSVTDQTGTSTKTFQKSGNDYTVINTTPDGSSEITKYNKLYQVVEKHSKDVLGQWIKKKIEYDHLGRVKRESEPYIYSANQWNSTEYDIYGRIIEKISYTGKVISISYNGLTSTVNDGSKTETLTKNASGKITEKTVSGTGTIQYTYFGNGKLKNVDFGGSTLIMEQDEWGRKTKLIDPSAGTFQYEYDGYGNVIREINPNGEVNFTFDTAGRVLTKTYSGKSSMDVVYNYNNSTKLLMSINMTGENNNSTYTYSYDSQRRLTAEEEITPYARFLTEYSYNTLDQISTEKYTAISNGKSSTKKLKNIYQYGGLKTIRDYNSNELIWEIQSMNQRGQALKESYGQSIEKVSSYGLEGFLTNIKSQKSQSGSMVDILNLDFDFDNQKGLLNSRNNSLFNWSENFTYDSNERLITWNDNDGNNYQSYDTMGRITHNSKVGDYGYTGSSFQQTSLDFNSSGQAHYNNLDNQTVNYNAFRKPISISEHGIEKVNFSYNAFEGRSNMYYGGTQNDPNQRNVVKHYSANGKMEVKHDSGTSKTTFITYLGGDAYNAPAIFHEEKGASTTSNEYFLHRDYLGSILAITDKNGNFKEKRHFDAWGQIVKLEDGSGISLASFKILDRGYTGHEHLAGVELIHMNGRLYDPVLQRFISPDNYVQDPSNPLNFNRYAYVLNNPLKYNDPNGKFIVAALIGAAIGIITNGIGNLINNKPFFRGAVKAGIFGAIGGALSFGIGQVATSISNSLSTTVSSLASKFIVGGFQASAHSLLGGSLAVVQGGKFGAGALSGAISSIVGSSINGIKIASKTVSAIVKIGASGASGGFGSMIAGGSFIDGFRQGLISGGLNHGVHSGWFGENIAAAAITQKLRHLGGPDAKLLSGLLRGGFGLSIEFEKGMLLYLRGGMAGTVEGIDAAAIGLALPTLSGEIGITNLYYDGGVGDINNQTFYGPFVGFNFGVDVGLSAGVQATYSSGEAGNVYGFGGSVGLGFSPYLIDLGIQAGATLNSNSNSRLPLEIIKNFR